MEAAAAAAVSLAVIKSAASDASMSLEAVIRSAAWMAPHRRQQVDEKVKKTSDDPTVRMWTASDIASTQALDISEEKRVHLQQQAMAMAQYCSSMSSRASAMLNFIQKECPMRRGDVMTLFRAKYPHYGLRWITRDAFVKNYVSKLLVYSPSPSPSPSLVTIPLMSIPPLTQVLKMWIRSHVGAITIWQTVVSDLIDVVASLLVFCSDTRT